MELELGVLLGIAIVGITVFGVFEAETARWRRLLKWGIITALTLGLHSRVGHAAVALPLAMASLGLAVHFWWCRRHGIHPLNATPRRRYYALRGWRWPE